MIIRFPRPKKETCFLDQCIPILLVTLALIIASYFFIDIPLAEYFRSNSPLTDQCAAKISALIDPKYHYLLWPLLFFYFKYGAKKEEWANRFLILTVSVVFAGLLTEILKHLLGRSRPELLFSAHIYKFSFFATSKAYLSFPSGHGSTIGAVCGVFACFYPRKNQLLALLALALAMSRVVLTFHYFGDILAGVALGLISSQWVFKVMTSKKIGEKWKTLFKMK